MPDALPITALFPILHERYTQAGEAAGHYFHQDLWAARKIYKANPRRHVDVGSCLAGFVAHLLVFREVEVIDVRPLTSEVDGLAFIQGDATELRGLEDDSIESISSLHAAEHFGLGRYGEPVDPLAHVKFMHALARVLKPGGRLYFAVPCGREKLCFNAHRVLSPQSVVAAFHRLDLVSFSCVKDDGHLVEDCPPTDVASDAYGCGLFEFTKPDRSRLAR
jgi:SAM-dependent methyltransferase